MLNGKNVFLCIVMLFVSVNGYSQNWSGDSRANGLQELKFQVPSGWTLHQDVKADGTLIMGFSRNNDYFRIYVQESDGFEFKTIFTKAQSVATQTERIGPFNWTVLDYSHTPQGRRELNHVKAFFAEHHGFSYYGFARSASSNVPSAMIKEFLGTLLVQPIGGRSLTGVGYVGRKFYLGFGDYLHGSMGNEVKYDIKHTSDIFTKEWGGKYIGKTLHGSGTGGSSIRSAWRDIGSKMTKNDMYVQYSSGHGSHSGLMIGVRYDEIRDNALSYSGKEVIVFMMSCYSGNLVSSFNRKKSEWQDWGQDGRTLYVMASSQPHETSATGPGTDPDEPGGPNGSAGSAFGHALWKALIGNADGYIDGVKDGFLSLGEIKDYTIWKTRRVGGHTPVVTGVFNGGLLMNQVPPKAYVDALENGTQGMSDSAINELIQQLDQEFRI